MSDTDIFLSAISAQTCGNAAGILFVIAELEIGLTHCLMALNPELEPIRRRNQEKARLAYEAAQYHVQSLSLTTEELINFDKKEHELRMLLGAFEGCAVAFPFYQIGAAGKG